MAKLVEYEGYFGKFEQIHFGINLQSLMRRMLSLPGIGTAPFPVLWPVLHRRE